MKNPTRILLRTDCTWKEYPGPLSMKQIEDEIKASCMDTVNLVDGVHVMLVDDTGALRGLKVNPLATALYMERCGYNHPDWRICGDAIVVPDSDFATGRGMDADL